MRERVLITGARAPAALDIARSFSAAGFEVHMADCVPSRMARWSRASAQVHRYPPPRADAARFREAIVRLATSLKPLIIVPTCEEVFHLAAITAITSLLYAPAMATLRRLHSKFAFAEECKAFGIATPPTTRVTSSAEIAPFRSQPADWVFKPEYSRFGSQTLVGPDARALSDVQPSIAAPWVVQRRIRGREVSFYATSAGSRLTAFSAYKSSWRFGGGAGYAFDLLEPALFNQLRDIASALAAKLVPQGQFACDAIVDDAGKPWLIECNPRATSGVFLFDRSPELALAMLGRRDTPLLGDKAGAHLAPALWFYGLPEAIKRKRFKEWASRRRTGRDVIGAPGDRAPVLGALADTLHFNAKALASRKSLAEAMTADIEWNGEEL